MNILLAAATRGEIAPTITWLHEHTVEMDENVFAVGAASVHVCLTGIGIMAATESLTRALLTTPTDFAVQAGVAGAFFPEIGLGEVVVVQSDLPAGLGAEDRDGTFLDLYSLGLGGKDDPPFTGGQLMSTGLKHPLGVAFSGYKPVVGITVQTVSGTAETIAAQSARYGAGIETMEGAPFHFCSLKAGVPFLQLRAISNYVEPRNRDAWRLGDAIESLNTALTCWLTELASSSLRAKP